jgi:hypothetical protein
MEINLNDLIEDNVDENEDWDNPFDYWYELDDSETDDHVWGEMSYNRLDKRTGWDDMELSELELFELGL